MAQGFKIGDRVRRKGDVGYGIIEYINGPGTSCIVRYILGVKQTLYLTEVEAAEKPVYQVWRQDDHGNKVMIHKGLTEFEATTIKDILERRGHKQMYWVDSVSPFSEERL